MKRRKKHFEKDKENYLSSLNTWFFNDQDFEIDFDLLENFDNDLGSLKGLEIDLNSLDRYLVDLNDFDALKGFNEQLEVSEKVSKKSRKKKNDFLDAGGSGND